MQDGRRTLEDLENGWAWKWFESFSEDGFDLLFRDIESEAGGLDLGRADFDENDIELAFVYDSPRMLDGKRDTGSYLRSLLGQKYESFEEEWSYRTSFVSPQDVSYSVFDKPQIRGDVLISNGSETYSGVERFSEDVIEPPLTSHDYVPMWKDSGLE